MPGRGEPEWLPEDSEYALAWQTLDADRCPSCNQPHDESMAPGMDDGYDVTVLRCFGCAAKSRAVEGFDNDAGLYAVVKRRD